MGANDGEASSSSDSGGSSTDIRNTFGCAHTVNSRMCGHMPYIFVLPDIHMNVYIKYIYMHPHASFTHARGKCKYRCYCRQLAAGRHGSRVRVRAEMVAIWQARCKYNATKKLKRFFLFSLVLLKRPTDWMKLWSIILIDEMQKRWRKTNRQVTNVLFTLMNVFPRVQYVHHIGVLSVYNTDKTKGVLIQFCESCKLMCIH